MLVLGARQGECRSDSSASGRPCADRLPLWRRSREVPGCARVELGVEDALKRELDIVGETARPLWNLTPRRSLNVQVNSSLDTTQDSAISPRGAKSSDREPSSRDRCSPATAGHQEAWWCEDRDPPGQRQPRSGSCLRTERPQLRPAPNSARPQLVSRRRQRVRARTHEPTTFAESCSARESRDDPSNQPSMPPLRWSTPRAPSTRPRHRTRPSRVIRRR